MGMVCKSDVIEACRNSGREKPLDLVHLSTMTMGDAGLERELLGMFAAQMPGYLEQARDCRGPIEVERLMHTIKGAARGIGAFKLAELAKCFESSGSITYSELESEIREVETFIAELR